MVGDGAVPAEPERAGVDWVLPTDPDTRPDLELVVTPGNDVGGQRLFWYFRSPHPTVGDGSFVAADLPVTVATTVRQLLNGVEDRTTLDDLPYYLRGVGRLPDFLGGPIFLGGWMESGSAFDDLDAARLKTNISVGTIAETLVGPVLLGGSFDFGGAWRYYIGIGRLF